jgi:SNF2 family DNA or RNA helicase
VSIPILRKDQREDAVFLCGGARRGLFNDPGTGKSFPAIQAAMQDAPRHILLVAPQYLLYNWYDMLTGTYMVPREHVALAVGERAQRNAILDDTEPLFTLINYEMFSFHDRYPNLLKRTWDVTIADECHKWRGRNSKSTKAAYKLKTDRLMPLTGTYMISNAADVFPILKMLDKERFRSYWRFVEEFCVTSQTPWGIVPGRPRSYDDYQEMLSEYVTLRPFTSIPELKDVHAVEKALEVDLPKSVMSMHRRALKEYVVEHPNIETIEEDSVGAILHILRKLCSFPPTDAQPKWQVVKELLSEYPDEQVVIFTWYHDTANLLTDRVRKAFPKRPVRTITGKLPAEARHQAVVEHRATDNGIVVANLAALREGENLQTGRIVIFFEEDYTRAMNEQGIARVKRYLQEREVLVYHVIARHTVDHAVYRTQARHLRDIQPLRALLRELYALD